MREIAKILFLLLLSNDISGQDKDSSLKITPLTGEFYVFTTFDSYKGNLVPANGMYLVTSDGVMMFDTPWDTTQFQPLLDSIKSRHHKNVVLCIATHFHEDRTGGLQYY
jgi:metallo-beta-lactamase class B